MAASLATTVEQRYVPRADIKGFSRFRADPDASARVQRGLEEAVGTHAKDALFREVVNGDAVTIVHDDFERLIACAQRIMASQRWSAPLQDLQICFNLLGFGLRDRRLVGRTANRRQGVGTVARVPARDPRVPTLEDRLLLGEQEFRAVLADRLLTGVAFPGGALLG